MKAPEWEKPDREWGRRRVYIHLRVTPGFAVALKEFCDRQTRNSGIDVSQANAIETTMKQAYPDIRSTTDKINKEWKSNGSNQGKRKKLGSTAQG